MASGATGFEMGFVIRLNSIAFGAFLTHPLLVIAMFPSEMFFYSHKITKGMTGVMVQAARLWAHKHSLLHLLCLSLEQFPWHFVPSPMHL